MNERRLRRLLTRFRKGDLKTDDLLHELRTAPFSDLGFARVDHHRSLRCGFPEAIFCEGKTPAQIERIASEIIAQGNALLATRASHDIYKSIRHIHSALRYEEAARCIVLEKERRKLTGCVLVVSAGTGDIPVAEEARVTAEVMGARVKTLYDVGVAGIHRLLAYAKLLHEARVLVVVAGMEGALASVVGGLVRRPVIAVPTSVGYGANFKGLAALLAMLNSCAPGVVAVNIDDGFGAGYSAALMNKTR